MTPLAHITIVVEGSGGKKSTIVALFNPNEITIDKSTNWTQVNTPQRDAPRSSYTHSQPAKLTVSLFFDTYETGRNVRDLTGEFYKLISVDRDMHRPPVCSLIWGEFGGSEGSFFKGVLENLNQRFTLFLPDGTPVRATVACTFREWRSDKEEPRKASADVVKTRIARGGDSLAGIAAEEYGDPALWRLIAEANGIDNPRELPPGAILSLPVLKPGKPRRSGA